MEKHITRTEYFTPPVSKEGKQVESGFKATFKKWKAHTAKCSLVRYLLSSRFEAHNNWCQNYTITLNEIHEVDMKLPVFHHRSINYPASRSGI